MRQLLNEEQAKAKKYKKNLMIASLLLIFIGLFGLIVNKFVGIAIIIVSIASFLYAFNIKVENYDGRN